jgi:hypothetical protein
VVVVVVAVAVVGGDAEVTKSSSPCTLPWCL